MHVSNIALAAAATATTRAAAKRAGINTGAPVQAATESTGADRADAPHDATTANKREFTWVSKSLARITAAWLRRGRPE